MASIHSFPASQKLKSRKTISGLFETGKTLKSYPIRAVYQVCEYDSEQHSAHVQMAISVPKRSFKNAVDRNRIKRQVRESYRMHHNPLLNIAKSKNQYLAIMLIYTDRKDPIFQNLDKKMKTLLGKFVDIV